IHNSNEKGAILCHIYSSLVKYANNTTLRILGCLFFFIFLFFFVRNIEVELKSNQYFDKGMFCHLEVFVALSQHLKWYFTYLVTFHHYKRDYEFRVEVRNTYLDARFIHGLQFKDYATVKVTVEDVDEPPVFTRNPYIIEVHEDTASGSAVGWCRPGTLTQTTNQSNNPRQTTRVPVFIKVLDVNDNAPEFAMSYDTFVCENVKSGQLIQTISAVDTDEPLVGHKFVFSISPTNPNFTIDDREDNTANILTKRGGFSRREMSVYFLPIVISDNDYPIQSSTSTLVIRVSSGGHPALCLHPAHDRGAVRRTEETEEEGTSHNLQRGRAGQRGELQRRGGGEEDTQAFDIGTLRNPEVMDANKLRRDIIPDMLFPFRRTSPIKDNTDVRDFINSRLQENDSDPTAPPYDSLATYAYEGSGSLAESLSSLESAATEGDQEYDYLSNWGPHFKKLAEMYIGKTAELDT
ncbi:hypothetical protein WMY93_031515, partial [Mugilogobius chulae]